MDWTKATDKQLWIIISEDWYIPENHIEGLITEALNRKMFDNLIKHLINKMFSRWSWIRTYQYSDLFSIGYIGVVTALKNYKEGKGSFKTFAHMNIKSEFVHQLDKLNSQKRKVYDSICSLDEQKFNDNEQTFLDALIDQTKEPEKVVINKLYWEETLGKLTKREKQALIFFAQGYSMNEIAKAFHITVVPIHRAFHRAINKINPNVKVNVKDLGLMTRTKEA